MTISDELMQEHRFILKFNLLMVDFAKMISSNNDVNAMLKYGTYFTDFIQNFADKFHHAKEEKILFDELVKPNILHHCNPIPVMLHEHEEGRAICKNIRDAIEKKSIKDFKKSVVRFKELLESHIFKEDNILYPMAEESLTDDKKSEISHRYKEAEGEYNKEALWSNYSNKRDELEAFLSEKS